MNNSIRQAATGLAMALCLASAWAAEDAGGGGAPVTPSRGVREIVLGTDTRVKVSPTTVAPYTRICRMIMTYPDSSQASGTGFMIGNQWMMTAGHCVFDSASGGMVTSIVVTPALDDVTEPFGTANLVAGSIHTPPQWTASEDNDYDIAWFKIDQPIGQSTGRFYLNSQPDGYFTGSIVVEVPGYPADLSTPWPPKEMYTGLGNFVNLTTELLAYDVDTFGGQSGSPVVEVVSGLVDAVHTTGDSLNSFNYGTRFTATNLGLIKNAIDDNYDKVAGGNQTTGTATNLTTQGGNLLSSINGLGVQWDDDYYRITVPVGSQHVTVNCSLTHADGNIGIALFNSAGATFTAVTGNRTSDGATDTETIDCVVPGTGAYYIQVFGDDMENTYDLVWTATTSSNVVFALTGGAVNVTEGGTTDTYTAVLDLQPTANVTVTLAPDAQVTLSTTTLTFTSANWNVPQTVTVTAVDNFIAQGNRSVTITHSSASTDARYNGVHTWALAVAITDNDVAGVTVTASGGSTLMTEGSVNDTYTLVLNSQPTANVVITVTAGTYGLVVGSVTLTFTAANWNTPQAVTISVTNDIYYEGLRTILFTQTAASADAKYNGVAISSVAATVTDDEPSTAPPPPAPAAGKKKKSGCALGGLADGGSGGNGGLIWGLVFAGGLLALRGRWGGR